VSNERLQIGQVADQLGLSIRTIRHYDEEGLVVPSERTDGGFRLYATEDVERLALIKRMRPLGFTLQEMRELLEAHDALERSAADGVADEDALARLAALATAADEKLGKLRKHVQWAEDFGQTMQTELSRYRRLPTARRPPTTRA
jgi:MerR family transcriptional regulator, copper efflux regulator